MRKCALCGKEFSTAMYDDWVYKRISNGKIYWYCGWNCKVKDKKHYNQNERKAERIKRGLNI